MAARKEELSATILNHQPSEFVQVLLNKSETESMHGSTTAYQQCEWLEIY